MQNSPQQQSGLVTAAVIIGWLGIIFAFLFFFVAISTRYSPMIDVFGTLGGMSSVAAIIFGHISASRYQDLPELAQRAKLGFTLGYSGLILQILLGIFAAQIR